MAIWSWRTASCGFRRALVCIAAGSISLNLAAQDAPCAAIRDDAARLICYDRGGPAPEAMSPAGPARAAAAERAPATLEVPGTHWSGGLAERWELDAPNRRETFLLRPYKPMYLLPVVVSDRVNPLPASPNPANVLASPLVLQSTESKFQVSFKTKVAQGVFGDQGDLWMAYTQSSRWQVYNRSQSRPFRETNYEPELMLTFSSDLSLLPGWQGRLLGLSLNHNSNGQSNPLSRSWNRVIGLVGMDRGEWSLMLRPWWRIPEAPADDDNPDIADHIGRADILLSRTWGAHLFSLMLRHSLRGGARSRGAAEIEWAYTISGQLRAHLQLFSGYGESLVDYNFRQSRIGVGVSLVEWR